MDKKSTAYKEETERMYSKFVAVFAKKFADYFSKHLRKEPGEFLGRIPKGGKILDVGSGSGDHAFFFKNNGYDVLCIDISEEMVRLCREKGLNAEVMDFEEMDFAPESFDGVWAYTSLLHTPKANIDKMLVKIKEILRPRGVLMVAMKEGSGERLESDERYPGTKRWMSLFSEEELRNFLQPHFKIEFFSKTKVSEGHVFLNYICRQKTEI
jgi:ubiquinone/menaquinone biosynthesis C-methylase UbiE